MYMYTVCRYTQVIRGTLIHRETTPIQATSCNEDLIVIAAAKDYYMYKDIMRPIQETRTFASAELVC